MNPELFSKFRKAGAGSSILVPDRSAHRPDRVVDWNSVVLNMIDHRDIGPSDFEKEYLCDMASAGALPTTSASGTTTSATASTGPALNAADLMKAMEAVIGSGTMKKILAESIAEVETVQAPAEIVEPVRGEHPEFGSW